MIKADLAAREELLKQSVQLVVQRRVNVREKGHLSNERHLSRHPRDWHSEIEGSAGELEPVAVRRWRDASSSSEKSLACTSRAMISRSLRSEEHTSELQSLMRISYAVFCLKKKTNDTYTYYEYKQTTRHYHN